MITIAIISLIITVIFIILIFTKDEFWFVPAGIFGILTLVFFLCSMQISWSTQNLSGYIYSSEENIFGYTTAHIRLAENAGMDVQPSFCVQSNSEAGKKIKEYSGSGKRVKVNIPPYFYFTNNMFACGTTKMTIEEVK